MAIIHGKVYIFQGKEWKMRKSAYTINDSIIHISDHMTGKMDHIPCISTTCKCNSYCLERMKHEDLVCFHCFAEKIRKETESAMRSNFEILNAGIIPDDQVPVFVNVKYVRIESFGDIGSVNHALNYIKIIRANPEVIFAWWTKNLGLVDRAFKIAGKPDNVIMVQSAYRLDKPEPKRFPWVDKVFTVYRKKTVKNDGIKINCGARSCVTCLRCYKKDTDQEISEQLK